jgi:hypothetical protein
MRAEALQLFREGTAQIIVSARSLIEGFNVPSADLGIVVAASSSVKEGEYWTGPRCGATYRFAAPGNPKPPSHNVDEIWTEVEGQIDLLATHLKPAEYPPKAGPLAEFLRALRRHLPLGGRIRVNEHGRAFTANENLFIGIVPLATWFRRCRRQVERLADVSRSRQKNGRVVSDPAACHLTNNSLLTRLDATDWPRVASAPFEKLT